MKKIVLITGASGEIGADIARVMSQNSYAVALHCNSSVKQAQALCDDLNKNGGEAKLFCADLSKSGESKRLVSEVLEAFGRIDVVVNNAGVSLVKPLLDTEDSEGETLLKINLTSAIEVSKYAAADMLKRKSGNIINISSVWGICGASCEVYYSAAKAGLIGFTKALAAELAPSKITVNCIAPGVVDTKMNAHLSSQEKNELLEEIPIGRFANGYDIAKAVLYLASADAEYITGQTLNISGGFLI